MRALITGIGGFAGGHLAEYLAQHTNWDVFGLARARRPGADGPVPAPAVDPDWAAGLRLQMVAADLNDYGETRAALAEVRPDLVFHLAAQAIVQRALVDPETTLVNNMLSQFYMLRALRELDLPARLLVIGSSEEYGHVTPDDLPVNEDTPFRPENPYAVSKIATDMLALQHVIAYKMAIIRLRPFNHIGPRQTEHFVTAAFARQVARIEAGLQEPVVRVGNLNAERDFTDVRDMVRAYYLAARHGTPGDVYNIGSGRATPVRGILDMLVGMSQVTVHIEQDPARMRPADVPVIVCDPRRFQQLTGWRAEIPIERSLADILDYWRVRTRAEQAVLERETSQ